MKDKISKKELTEKILNDSNFEAEVLVYLYDWVNWQCNYPIQPSLHKMTFDIMDMLREQREIQSRLNGSYQTTLTAAAVNILSEELARTRNTNGRLRLALQMDLFQKCAFSLNGHTQVSPSNVANTILDQPILARKVYNILEALTKNVNGNIILKYDIYYTVQEIMNVLRENQDLVQNSLFGLYGTGFSGRQTIGLANVIIRLRSENKILANMKPIPKYSEMKHKFENDARYNDWYYDSDEF